MPIPIYYELLLVYDNISNPTEWLKAIEQTLHSAGDIFIPKYLNQGGGRRKPVALNDGDTVTQLLKSHTITTPEGSSSSFVLFSDTPGVMISFTVGINSTFRVSLPLKKLAQAIVPLPILHKLFYDNILVSNPYWGCIQNTANCDRFYEVYASSYRSLKVDGREIPRLIHWYNYFETEFMKQLGITNLVLNAPYGHIDRIQELDGVVWILQTEPFDDTNPEHRHLQEKAMHYLQLSNLHRKFIAPNMK